MRTKHKTLIIAISTALLTTTGVYAQVKDPNNVPPVGPATSQPLGAEGLPGQLCSESPGASGATCSPVIPTSGSTDSRFEVTGCEGAIRDVNIGLDLSHTWVGDLTITVRSPELTSVTIVETPGGGCSYDNIFAVLDDAAVTNVEQGCTSGNPAINGTFSPTNPLSAINGEAGNGIWLLTIVDGVAGDGGQLNDWSVDLACGEPEPRATFEVNKVFTDGNPGDVDVTLSCFTGLPLVQTQTISESQNVVFVVTDYDDGELDCEVTEEDVTGYSAEYDNGPDTSSESCEYEDVGWSASNVCTITNNPNPVEIAINKRWIIEGSGGDQIDPSYFIGLQCYWGEIVGGYLDYSPSPMIWRKDLYEGNANGTEDVTYTALVIPDWQGRTECYAYEQVYDSSVDGDDYCNSHGFPVELGDADGTRSCTITNTVFYEGIPTLSNYGLALLTLMMLGVGFVGFRRFA